MSRLRFSWQHYYLVAGLGVMGLVSMLGGRQTPATAGERPPSVSNHGHMQTTISGRVVVLPLSHTAVQAEVVGVISSVRVTQEFLNPHSRPIEAVYVFPLPHRAAIHAMTMRIGDRVIQAHIRRRDTARAEYRRAKRQGKTASLLEQERPNVFTQSVANIMPGQRVHVELGYVEELTPEDGRYSFVFPMVVGPRYMGEAAPRGGSPSGTGRAPDNQRVQDASRISPPLLPPGVRSGHDISLSLRINAGIAIRDVNSPSHSTTVKQPVPDMAQIDLDPTDRIPNRDFVARYRLAGNTTHPVVLAARDAKLDGHLLLMIQPKARPVRADIAPREYVFVVDTSGSMSGTPLEQIKQAMHSCLGSMQPQDRFQVVQFAGDASALAPAPLPPTEDNLQRALAFISTMSAGGGTEFLPALELALRTRSDPRRSRIVLFMTDGYIGYEAEVLRFLRHNLAGANLFALGVGSAVNRYLIDAMARIGGGEPFVLLGREGEAQVIRRFFDTVSRPALTGITIQWGDLPVEQATPARVPDLFADRPVVVAARYHLRDGKPKSGIVTLRGFLAGEVYEQQLKVTLPAHASASGTAQGQLWARRQIGELMDRFDTETEQSAVIKRRVTQLALDYGLMSKWTAFVAVDRVVHNRGGSATTVPVPLPLPEGVTPQAASPTAFLEVKGALSTDQFVPGDPEVQIRAPDDAVAVTLFFPTGEVKSCARSRLAGGRPGVWRTSFLIPEDTPDGIYTVRVLIALHGGRTLERTLRYQVDGSEPRVRVRLHPLRAERGSHSGVRSGAHPWARAAPGALVTLTVEPLALTPAGPPPEASDIGDPSFDGRVLQEIRSARARLPGLEMDRELTPGADGSHTLEFQAPDRPGRYPVTVVVRDPARNKVRRTLWLVVD